MYMHFSLEFIKLSNLSPSLIYIFFNFPFSLRGPIIPIIVVVIVVVIIIIIFMIIIYRVLVKEPKKKSFKMKVTIFNF